MRSHRNVSSGCVTECSDRDDSRRRANLPPFPPAVPLPLPLQFVSVPYEDLVWQRLFPELGELSGDIAIVNQNPNTGATQLFIRTPAQIHTRLHWHSANETHTVIAGEWTFRNISVPGSPCQTLGVGGFNFIPGGQRHEAWSTPGAVVFVTTDGPFDISWVDHPPTIDDVGVVAPCG